MIISDLDPDLVESALFFALESGPGFFIKLIPGTGKKYVFYNCVSNRKSIVKES